MNMKAPSNEIKCLPKKEVVLQISRRTACHS